MALTISSAFDAGNIRVVKQDGDRVDLEIVTDHMSDFYQWFYFRARRRGRPRSHACASPIAAAPPIPTAGPTIRRDVASTARIGCGSTDTSYADGVLTMTLHAADRTGVDRLFRALFDGAAPRSGDADRGACRSSPTARSARASTARTSTA